jgi:hypothetical protein
MDRLGTFYCYGLFRLFAKHSRPIGLDANAGNAPAVHTDPMRFVVLAPGHQVAHTAADRIVAAISFAGPGNLRLAWGVNLVEDDPRLGRRRIPQAYVIAVYDCMLARFGAATELPLRELVAKTKSYKDSLPKKRVQSQLSRRNATSRHLVASTMSSRRRVSAVFRISPAQWSQ